MVWATIKVTFDDHSSDRVDTANPEVAERAINMWKRNPKTLIITSQVGSEPLKVVYLRPAPLNLNEAGSTTMAYDRERVGVFGFKGPVRSFLAVRGIERPMQLFQGLTMAKGSIIGRLDNYIQDEQNDHDKYLALATDLREMGKQEDASAVYGIAADEARHKQILETVRAETISGEQ